MAITKLEQAGQDANNSSTTPLSGGATFTGTATKASSPAILVQSYSNVAGTLYIDFSVDGTNWDSTYPVNGYACSAAIPEVHAAKVDGRYYRIRYVNGSSAQTTFRLGVFPANDGELRSALNQPYTLDADSVVVRPTQPWLDIARGLVTGITPIKKFGRATVGTTYTPLCFGGNGTTTGIYRTPQSGSATTLRIKSGGNTNDTAGGSGAREITLEGLDENFDIATEAIATNGSSASLATTTTFTRLHRAYVSASGTYATATAGSQAGEIIIEDSGGTENWGVIPFPTSAFPEAQSSIGAYSVPRNYSAYVFLDNITVDSGKTADIIFFHRGGADETAAPYTAMRAKSKLTGITGGSTDLSGRTTPFGPFVGPCDIGFMGRVSTTTGQIACEFEIYLINET